MLPDSQNTMQPHRTQTAKIYQPAKSAMQSGKARNGKWLLEFIPDQPRKIDPIMGYTTSSDTQAQVRLTFDSAEEAIAYATRKGIAYQLISTHKAKRRKISYTDNFRHDRLQPWTH